MVKELKHVFTPLRIGKMEIKNRFIVSPMVMNYCTEDGMATEKFIAYHEEKAKGGWGLIITEDYAVDPMGKGYPYIPGFWKDEQIESHAEVTRRVHAAGGKILAQIYHAGRQTQARIIGAQPVAPSAIPCPVKKEVPRELTTGEIREIVGKFGDAALRAKKAGFDGVQMHAGHGYLISQFMSSYSNKRTDEYGGCLYNRMRFALEIVADIRKKCGDDFVIDYKISGEEAVAGGLTIEDTKTIAMYLEEAGIDSLNVSIGVYESWYTQVQPAVMGHGWISHFAEEVKKVVSIPVTTVGRVNDPLIADAIIKSGKADACYMGRASLADPHLPNKAKAGDFADIIRCTACLQGCTTKIDLDCPGQCVVNPRTGRESEFVLTPAVQKKNIFVAGGGPAGCEAAIVLAERGHTVTLFEAEERLGGMFYTASVPPWKGEISTFLAWQRQRLARLGVTVHLGTRLTAEIVAAEQPDTVIVATGSLPAHPPVPGLDLPFVHTAVDYLNGKFNVSGSIAVIGGGLVGGETAHQVLTHGNEVTILEMLPEIVAEEPNNLKHFLHKAFKEGNVSVFVNTMVKKVQEDGTIVIARNGTEETIGKFDAVLLATGMRSVNGLMEELKGKVAELVAVGDAQKASNALEAIQAAYALALSI